MKNFTIRYVFRAGGRTHTGQTVWAGETRTKALSDFLKQNPQVISAHVV